VALTLASVQSAHSGLEVFWFIIIAILWSGYFVLEGFDFGVGILPRSAGAATTSTAAC